MEFNLSLEYDRDTTSLSMYDLMSVTEFREAVLREDVVKLDSLLYDVGVDVEKGYMIADRLHRPLTSKDNTPVVGGMLIYIERKDTEWIESGCASMEAVIKSSVDRELQHDLWRMQDAYLSMEKVKAKADGC